MSIYFVSRHAGAREWARQRNIRVDRQVTHLEPDQLTAGDVVIGTLPAHLAAAVCARGARYLHLTLDLPAELRGRELTAAEMSACNARLQELRVEVMGDAQ